MPACVSPAPKGPPLPRGGQSLPAFSSGFATTQQVPSTSAGCRSRRRLEPRVREGLHGNPALLVVSFILKTALLRCGRSVCCSGAVSIHYPLLLMAASADPVLQLMALEALAVSPENARFGALRDTHKRRLGRGLREALDGLCESAACCSAQDFCCFSASDPLRIDKALFAFTPAASLPTPSADSSSQSPSAFRGVQEECAALSRGGGAERKALRLEDGAVAASFANAAKKRRRNKKRENAESAAAPPVQIF